MTSIEEMKGWITYYLQLTQEIRNLRCRLPCQDTRRTKRLNKLIYLCEWKNQLFKDYLADESINFRELQRMVSYEELSPLEVQVYDYITEIEYYTDHFRTVEEFSLVTN